MTDIVDRLRGRDRDWDNAGGAIKFTADDALLMQDGAYEIERLRAALQRIDGINDNPSIYNPDIEAVLRAALDEQVAQ